MADSSSSWKVDASELGCSGMFWRKPGGVVSSQADWPRNGTLLKGKLAADKLWVRILATSLHLTPLTLLRNVPNNHR